MTNYLLIESRDAFEARDNGGFCSDLAASLSQRGNLVTVFAVQNGVLSLRAGAHHPALAAMIRAGVNVRADTFSLRERAIRVDDLADGVVPCELHTVIDCMVNGWRVVWH